ncbi:hypothetical protein WME95_27575 [Sorangium sp. So ce327]|uniref:hypothetical protein n=1 Tax=Sorangium sp. So ce327 TaxID=3133301 RepID=UPI003F62C995
MRQLFVCSVLAIAAIPVGCTADAPEDAEQESEVGSLSLALVGNSSSGATYRLSQAWFDIYGPTARTIYGGVDTPVLAEVLPVGGYNVALQPGWVLERWTGGGYQAVSASLTSANPTWVYIGEGTTSTVAFQFRADGDVISVGQGRLDIVIGVDDTTPPREDTDVACSNGYDDDGDGRPDCSDPDCQFQPFCGPIGEDTDWECSNGYDDDMDGLADCSDPDCQGYPFCAPVREDTDWACSNGADDDMDGLADCADPECQPYPFCSPWREDTDWACSNGVDDDGDGLADCSDPECQWMPYCMPVREDTDWTCSNGADDDGDGAVDCSDADCQSQPYCMSWREDTDWACSNGSDDDADGLTDCSDPDCVWLPVCAMPGLVIEDFEDGDFLFSAPYAGSAPPFTGPWVTYDDGTVPPVDLFPAPGPFSSTALAAHSPGVPSASGAGVALSFEMWPVDVSPFQGIRFHIRGQGTQVRFDVGTLLTTPEGGLCSACYDSHGIDLWVGPEWVTVELRWWDLMQQGWGTLVPFEPWNVMNLNWRTPVGQPLRIEIDDVQLF